MTEHLWQWGAARTVAAVRAGEVSCVEVVESAVERMRQANTAVNAVTVDLGDDAIAAARRTDAAQAGGAESGPLAGVPVTIKENVDQAGQATPNGVPAYRDVVAGEDSPVVANLRRAGAIVIARTNTPEFSLRWFTSNPLRGRTLNPWSAAHTPGGSSGGAAAAVALGIGAIGHGNDLGGSLRYPAYCCGVASVKPTTGRVPAFNPTATGERPPGFQLMSVQGPIAREVADLRLALVAMSARDPRDPGWVPAPLPGERTKERPRVAVTRAPFGSKAGGAAASAVDEAARWLADAGHVVDEVEPPLGAEVADCWRVVLGAEVRVMYGEVLRTHGSDDIRFVCERGFSARSLTLDLEGYMRALADRARLVRAWAVFMERWPLVLAPVSCAPPYRQDEDLQSPERLTAMIEEQSPLYGVNCLGLPAVAVATGVVEGLPTGVQVVGRAFREDECLDAAAVIERAAGLLTPQLWAR
jgi:amidase